MSEATWELLACSDDEWHATGGIEVKGKGIMETHLWVMPQGFLCEPVNTAALIRPSNALLNLFSAHKRFTSQVPPGAFSGRLNRVSGKWSR